MRSNCLIAACVDFSFCHSQFPIFFFLVSIFVDLLQCCSRTRRAAPDHPLVTTRFESPVVALQALQALRRAFQNLSFSVFWFLSPAASAPNE
jgi:hypothetical protein